MSASPIKLEPLARPRRAHKSQQPPKPQRPLKLLRKKPRQPPAGLAARRELNGVSLNDIAERTRIPLRHLEELERGDISHWPAGVYAKSWAREYAVEAGLDPDEIVALVAPVAAVEPTIAEIKQVREASERRSERVRNAVESYLSDRLAAVAVVIALLVLAGIFIARYEPERRGVPADTAAQPVGTSGVSPEGPR